MAENQDQNNVVLNFQTNGEVQYAKTLSQINMVMQTAVKEYQSHVAAMDSDASMTEKLIAEKKKLDTQMNASTEKVKMLRAEYEAMSNNTSTTAAELQNMYNKLLTAETAHAKLDQAMKRVNKGLTEEAIAARDAQKALKELGSNGKTLEAEQRKLVSAFELEAAQLGKNATEAQKAELAQRRLAAQTELTGRAVDNIENQLKQAKIAYGENSTEVMRLETQLNEARTALHTFGDTLEDIETDADSAGDSLGELGGAFQALAGVVAGLGLGAVIAAALAEADTTTEIAIRFDVPEESQEAVRTALSTVKKYGIEGDEALKGMQRQWLLNKDATDEANEAVVEGAAAMSRMFSDLEFSIVVDEINLISKTLKITNQEAMDLTYSLLKVGLNPEQINIISTYSKELIKLGYTAKEVTDLFASAISSGSFNIESLMDGLAEGFGNVASYAEGVSDTTKDSLRKIVGETKKATEEQLESMQESFAKSESKLSKSLDNRMKVLTKSHENQKKAVSKALEEEIKVVTKSYEKQEKQLEKSLNAVYQQSVKKYNQQQRALEKSLSAEVKAFEKATERKLKLIDKEYFERMKLVDEDRYNQLKALDAQINGIEAITDAEDRALKKRQDAEKIVELKEGAANARTWKERRDYEKSLADFEEQLKMEAIREGRQLEIDALNVQKDNVNDVADAKKDALKDEAENRKDAFKSEADEEREKMKERQDDQKEALKEQNALKLSLLQESNKAELDALKQVNAERLDLAKEEQENRKSALGERLSTEAEAVREAHAAELESFKKMNAEKLEIAKDPPDSAAAQALFTQLEDWGKALESSGENSGAVFRDMVAWLDEIEDAALRNAIGAEIFGEEWDAQGEEMIQTVLNAEGALVDLQKEQDSFVDGMKKINESPTAQITRALESIKESLAPLLEGIAGVVGWFAKFASDHPMITSAFVAIGSVIAIVVALFAALAPAIAAIPALIPAITAGFTAVSGVVATLTGALPVIGAAIAGLAAPIGIAIAAIVLIVAAIIGIIKVVKNWGAITDWISDVWTKFIEGAKNLFNGLTDFFKKWGPTILAALFGPIGLMVKFLYDNWDDVKKKTKDTFNALVDLIKIPIDKAKDAVKSAIDAIKGFFDFEFKWPELKMPTFEFEGTMNPLKWFDEGIPTFDVKWNAKGGIFTQPTIFGASNGQMQGAGEAGPEAVLPLNEKTLGDIGKGIVQAMGGMGGGDINVYLTLDGETVARKTIKYTMRELYEAEDRESRGRR